MDGTTFPKETVAIRDPKGFPRIGELVDGQIDETNGLALYYFTGDFIVGDPFEIWLDPVTAQNADLLRDFIYGEEAETDETTDR